MIPVKISNTSPYPLPGYATTGAAGVDLYAHIPAAISIQPLERLLVPTGIYIEIPEGYEAQIRPRSGLAIKKGLTMVNTPGTIDSDYRGEINIIMINLSHDQQYISPGERIAQMIFARYEKVDWIPVESMSESQRGRGGFGSTGA